jgi:hypothetical protein
MYKRLLSIAKAFKNVGAKHIDDEWVKEKYIDALMPYEPINIKSLQGRYNYHQMTSNEVMQEMQAFKVAERNAEDSRNRAIGMAKGANLALKANMDEDVEEQDVFEASKAMSCPEDMKHHWNDFMAFAATTFWKNLAKEKEKNIRRNNSSGYKGMGPRTRSCYSCNDKYHFIAECPYERREDHGGKLIPKTKVTFKKPPYKNKKNFNNKKQSRIVLLTQKEYSFGDGDDEEEDEETSNGVTAIATTSTPSSSLFESPNENPPTKNAHCLMARSSEVSSPTSSLTKSKNSRDDDYDSLKVKQEIVEFNHFLSNLQGVTKKHVEALMSRLGQLQELYDDKCRIERGDS